MFEELNPVIKYLYFSDAVFHCMIVNHSSENNQIPYDSMLILNEEDTICSLTIYSSLKRKYETLILELIYKDPFIDFTNHEQFKNLDKQYDLWGGKLEELVRAILYDSSKQTVKNLKNGGKEEK